MMSPIFKLLLTCCLTLGILGSKVSSQQFYNNADTYVLTIDIEGIIVNKGMLYVALYTSEDDFLKRPYRNKKVSLIDFSNRITFKNLPKGEYAVMIYQDLNDNKKLDKLFSIPLEPYGVSNNVNSFPKFKNSKIELIKNEKITINIKN